MSEHTDTLVQLRAKIAMRRRNLAKNLLDGASFDPDHIDDFLQLDALLMAVKLSLEEEQDIGWYLDPATPPPA